MANLIADEARLNNHEFGHHEMVFERLVRHEKLITVSYSSDRIDQEALLPPGMRQAELYIL